MAYWTPSGLQRLAQSESSGRANLIHYPTGYTSKGVKSSASGLYGFLDTTWRQQAPKAGVDINLYPRAYQAPASVQTAVAAQTPTSHWTCKDCNSTANRLATDPAYVTATPGSGGSGNGGDGDYGGGYTTTDDPALGGQRELRLSPDLQPYVKREGDLTLSPDLRPYSTIEDPGVDYTETPYSQIPGNVTPEGGLAGLPGTGLGTGTAPGAGAAGGGLPALLTYTWDKLLRLALIVLGVVLVAVAAWAMARGEFKTA